MSASTGAPVGLSTRRPAPVLATVGRDAAVVGGTGARRIVYLVVAILGFMGRASTVTA